jgi:alkaline phosphatase
MIASPFNMARPALLRMCRLALAVAAMLAVGAGIACPGTPSAAAIPAPKNVILLIGDGMGFGHLRAAGLYGHGQAGTLFMESLPHRARVVTASASTLADREKAAPTDSAAAATAMATGVKVHNGVLSMAIPGAGGPLRTILEHFAAQGRMTGLVTTSYITDATPAAFAAHAPGRRSRDAIVDGYLRTVRPHVIMGGGDSIPGSGLTPAAIRSAGYSLVTDRAGLAGLKAAGGTRVFGLFGSGNLPYETQTTSPAAPPRAGELPTLAEMAAAALTLVAAEPRGFFLMAEGGLIDKAAHARELESCLLETLTFDRTVRLVMDWAAGRSDTLVLVTADHETNGLEVVRGNGPGRLPDVRWTRGGHTNAEVPLFAWGVGADQVSGVLDNTALFGLMTGAFTKSPATQTPAGTAPVAAQVPRTGSGR